MKDKPGVEISLDVESRGRLLRAAQGLTLKEAENVFAKTLVMGGRLDGDDVNVVSAKNTDHPQERPAGILRRRRKTFRRWPAWTN